ncbi:hypothetical protein KM043_018410 [Ampulex compressa]|nr:hypothetical protein KM043_018410 [Ampulex compressa]
MKGQAFRIDPAKAIAFTKLSVTLLRIWPPSPQASKSQVLVHDILWTVFLISCILLILPLANALYVYRNDARILTDTIFYLVAAFHIMFIMLVCRLNRKEFQALIAELENFCKRASFDEKNVLQRYIDKYALIYGCFAAISYLATVGCVSLPICTSQEFPTYAKYPFSMNHLPLKALVYMHQCLVGFQASASVSISCKITLLLSYISARFELLAIKFESVTNESELDNCIEIHSALIRNAEIVETALRLIVLAVVSITSIAVIFAGYNTFTNESIMTKLQYIMVTFIAALELFMYAWPADHFSNMTRNIYQAVYNSHWVAQPLSMQRKVIYIMLRSQKPQAIKIAGFLPYLSLQYYSSIVACAVYSKQLQSVIHEMERFCKRREEYVQDILCYFIEQRAKFYGFHMIFGYCTGLFFVLSPFFQSYDFPTYGEYPFAINGTFIRPVVYISQASVTMQCAAHVSMIAFIGLLLWFTAAKFEILAVEFQKVTNIDEILECIKKHQANISYAEEVILVTRSLILPEILSGAMRVVLSSLSILTPMSGTEIIQSFMVTNLAFVGTFLCIWPADYLMDVNEAILQAVYDSPWYNTLDTRKQVLFILMRCQKRMIISAGVVLPAASLPYFRAYVSAAASYFTFLRIMLNMDNK